MFAFLSFAAFAAAAPTSPLAPRAIVGGERADTAAFGAVVALAWEGEIHCTGTRVDAAHILTAAHCAPATEVGLIGAGDGAVGDLRWTSVSGWSGWNGDDPRDVGLLRVDDLDPGPAMPLLAADQADALASDAPLWVAGFGAVDASGAVPSDGLRVGEVALVDASCDATALGCNAAVPPGVEWITGGPADACFGDSGGPVGVWRDGRAVQAAVTSRGVLGASRACGEGGIASRVDGLSRWLRREGVDAVWVGDAPGCAVVPRPNALGVLALAAGWLVARRRTWRAVPLALAACGVPDGRTLADDSADTALADDPVATLAEVLAAPPSYGAVVTVGPLRVTTAASPIDRSVLLHDATGVGLRVLPSVRTDAWPPPVGHTVQVDVVWVGTAADPQGYLPSEGAWAVLDDALAWTDDDDLGGEGPYRLVAGDLRVASWPDPSGRADAVGPEGVAGVLVDRWAVGLPPVGTAGAARFVRWPDGSWTPLAMPPPGPTPTPRAVVLADVVAGEVPDGETVTLQATQQAPWSPDRRWTAIADAEAEVGLWVDAEGFGAGVGQAGDLGVWQGEVRTVGGVRVLRTWWDRQFLDVVPPVPVDAPVDGRLGLRRVDGLGPVDGAGERVDAEGVVWDPRLTALDGLVAGTDVLGVWWVRPDDLRFVPIP